MLYSCLIEDDQSTSNIISLFSKVSFNTEVFRYNQSRRSHESKEIFNVSDHEIAYIGDGLIDIPLLERVGLACTVPGAHDKVASVCDYTTVKEGGHGAFREVVELILIQKGVYDKIYEKMSKEIYKA